MFSFYYLTSRYKLVEGSHSSSEDNSYKFTKNNLQYNPTVKFEYNECNNVILLPTTLHDFMCISNLRLKWIYDYINVVLPRMILIYWAYLLYMCTPKSEIGHYFIFFKCYECLRLLPTFLLLISIACTYL
jgi:hypothetical protein